MTDREWDLIADLFPTYSGGGRMGRPAKHAKRDIVNAVLYVASTGCQWRSLPKLYPPFSTVHAYHVRWSRDGVWEAVADRLRAMARVDAGHDPDPSASIIDARSVRGASTVTAQTRGYDAGKKISGRKTFGLVDTLGLLIAVVVVVASTSDNTGGIAVFDEGPGQDEPAREAVVRQRLQEHLRAALPAPRGRCRGCTAHPPARVRGPPTTLDRRADLVVADEQPPTPSRL